MDITAAKVLPWILFALTLLGYVWTASSINTKLDYLMERDKEERKILLESINPDMIKLRKPAPSIQDTL